MVAVSPPYASCSSRSSTATFTMKFRCATGLVVSALCLHGVSAQILNIPEVDAVVSSVLSSFSAYVTHALQEATATAQGVAATPTATGSVHPRSPAGGAVAADPPYWLADIPHQGIAAFNPDRNNYTVFRNVKDYGAVGTLSFALGLRLAL